MTSPRSPTPHPLDFRVIFDASSNSMAITNASSGRIVDVNDTWIRATGITRAEALGKSAFELGLWARAEDRQACIDALEHHGHIANHQACLLLQGKEVPHLVTGRIIDLSGKPCSLWEFRDIGDRVKFESAIREREELLSAIFSHTADGIDLVDVETLRILEVNDAACQMMGYSRDEYLRLTLADIQPDMDVDAIRLAIAGILRKGGDSFVARHKRKDGGIFNVRLNIRVARLRGRDCLIAVWHDITEEEIAKAALQNAASWHQALLQSTVEGICIFDEHKAVLECNDRFAAMLGYAPTELAGMHPWDWDASHTEAKLDAKFPLTSTLPSYTVETRHRRKNGSVYDAEVAIQHARIDGRTVTVSAVRDITQRKEAERQFHETHRYLERERAFLRTLIRTIPDLVWLKDPNGIYLTCNPEFERFFGHPESEIIGKSDYDFISKDLADFFRNRDRMAIAAGKAMQNEEWITYACDGHRALLVTTKTPMYGPDGELIGVLGIAHDITERKRIEEQLRDSEERFRTLFEESRDAIYLHDGPTIVDCNPAALTLLDIADRGQIIGQTLARWAVPDASNAQDASTRIEERIQAALMGPPQRFEWLARRNDGGEAILDVRLSKVDIGGNPYVQAIARDITRRRRAEMALGQERKVRETILESIPGIFYAMDAQGFFTFWNRNFERVTGREPDELVHFNALDLFEGHDRTHIAERIGTAFAQGESDAEADLVAKDGRRTPYFFTGLRIELDGQPFVVGTGVDISRRKAAEQALRQLNVELETRVRRNTAELQASYAKLRTTEFAMDYVGIGIHWVDFATGRFIHVNRYAAELLGYTREELLRLAVPDIDPHYPLEAFQEINRRIREQGHMKFETEQIRRDGSRVPVEMTVYYHKEEDGVPPRMISFMLDITARKRAEQELIEAKSAAEAATVAKSAFLANMSHEIRTPLNAILGLSYLLRQETISPAQRAKIDKVDIAGRHLLSLINDILDLSKIEAGKLVLHFANFNLSSVLDNVVSIVKDSAVAKGLVLDVDPDHVPQWLWGDATRLRQALLNYAGNAVKFTERGSIHLRARVLEEGAKNIRVRFEVTDTGIGIKQDQIERLFNDFEQADTSIARKYEGTGLGLSLTRRLVELMGGTAGVNSIHGSGSTFWFEVPLEHGHGPTPVDSERDHPISAESWLQTRRKGARILLADDNAINVEVVVQLLHSVGMDVAVAENGLQAVALAQREIFDLVLMDMQMPEMSGTEATRLIRAIPGWKSVPILALTANAFPEDQQACIDAGMNDVLAKPLEPSQLYAALRRWLERAKNIPPAAGNGDIPASIDPLARLRAVEGVDIDTGTRMLAGNGAKYRELLLKFLASAVSRLAACRKQLVAGLHEDARASFHSIKGVAATLGLHALSAEAADIETLLRNPDWLEAHAEEAISRLEGIARRLAKISAACETMPRANDPGHPGTMPSPPKNAVELLAGLMELLSQYDMAAINFLQANDGVLRQALGNHFDAILAEAEQFNFDAALDILRKQDTA